MPVEVVRADLQQLVARIALEDRGERLAAMAGGQKGGALDDIGDLPAQQRHLPRILGVYRVRIEAEEARLSDDLALGAEALYAYVIEVSGAVHRGARVRLGEHQELLHPRPAARFRRQRGEARRARLAALAQDAEPAAGDDAQHILAVHRLERIVPAAEEGEVVVQEPGEEGAPFFELGLRHRAARLVKPLEGLRHARLHRSPVLHRSAHVGQHACETRLELGQLRRIALAVDLDMHEGLEASLGGLARRGDGDKLAVAVAHAAHHRMDHEVQREALAVDFHRHRVDEERHVVVDDLDHAVAALPAVLRGHRVVGPDLRRAAREPAAELQMRRRRAREVARRARRQLLGVDLGVVKPGELVGDVGLRVLGLGFHA